MDKIKQLKDRIKNFFRTHNRLTIVGIVILALSLPFVINQVLKQQDLRQRASSAPPLTFKFSPSPFTFALSEGIMVDLLMTTNVNDVGSLKLKIIYDPSMLAFNGNEYPSALKELSKTSANGEINIIMLNPSSTKVTGSDVSVLKLLMRALKTGTTTIKVESIEATVAGQDSFAIIDNPTNIIGTYTITSQQMSPTPIPTSDICIAPTGLWPNGCSCTNDSQCLGKKCKPSSFDGSGTCADYLSPTPPTSNTQHISCTDGTSPITFNMKSPFSATADGPISSITLTSGDWCAWSPADNINYAKCPVKCPELNPAANSTTTTPITLSADNLSFSNNFDTNYNDNSGSCTYAVTCSNIGTPYPTLTPISTTPTPTPSPIPTATSAPTPTPAPGDTLLRFAVFMPGIGNGAANLGLNSAPIHPQREGTISLVDENAHLVKTVSGIMQYSSADGFYAGTFALGTTFPTGVYNIKLRMSNTLVKLFPTAMKITTATNNSQSGDKPTLIPGDLNNDNTLGVIDWTLMIACIKNEASCTENVRKLADLNDNGKIDELDVQILQRGFALRDGD